MSKPAAPEPSAPAPRRWPRRALAALAALALLLGAAFWWLGRESTLQALVQKLADASGGQVAVGGVTGSLYGAMHLAHIRYRDREHVITAERVDIDWAPWQYFSDGIAISRLRVASLLIENVGPARPPELPASLAPPFRLSIAAARLERVTLRDAGRDIVVAEVGFQLSGDGAGWRLRQGRAVTPWGALAADDAVIKAARPFALDAAASLSATSGAARLDARARGDLARFDVKLTASSPHASGEGLLTLTPVDAVTLRAARISGRGIDPARFDPAWPRADLGLELTAAIGPDQRVSGQLALSNRGRDGPLDRRLLPLRGASARLGGTLSATSVDAVLLDLGAAGKLEGAGHIARGGPEAAIGHAALALRAGAIDLRALHGGLRTTRIAGDIKLDSDGATHKLDALLTQDGLRLALRATLADALLRVQQARLQAGKGSLELSGQASLRDARPFQASASALHFNPADVGDYPAADLNATARIEGRLAPRPLATADVTLAPSRLFGQPLSGAGKLTADAAHVSGARARLALGRNTLELDGAFGAPGERLTWRVEAGQLSALRGDLSGALSASGVAEGTWAAARSSFDAEARGLGLASGHPAFDSALRASGAATLTAGKAELSLTGAARRVSPAAFGPYPTGDINADFSGGARLGADWRVALKLALRASTLAGAPLSGGAAFNADAARVDGADIDLRLGPNSLRARGGFGGPRERLDWKLDAPRLASLGPGFGGALRGAGALSGGAAMPSLSLTLDGAELRLFQHQARTLRASASLGAGLGAADPLVCDIALGGYRSPTLALAAARLQTSGTRAAHTLRLAARNDDFDASAQLTGGWNGNVWNGALDALQNRGRFGFALREPAPLRLAGAAGGGAAGLLRPERIALSNAVFRLAGGGVSVRSLEKTGARWRSEGQATGVPLAYLTQLSPAWRQNASGDLTLGARWSLASQAAAEPALAGSLHVYREQGDVTVGTELPVALGLRTLDARVDAAERTLRLRLDIDGARAGQAHLAGSAQLLRGRVALDSALQLTGNADMASLAWLAPLAGQPGLELDGALRLALTVGGSVGKPLLDGDISGERLLLNWADQGLKLRNGQLQARLAGDQLLLQRLRFDGAEGHADVKGTLRFANAEASMQLTLTADRLQALSRPDRVLVVSGQSVLIRDQKRFRLEGKFKAERARIELAAADTPTLSDDVVVLGKAGAGPKPAPSPALDIDLEADLGDDFHMKGKGLDAQLAGGVRLRALDRRPPRVNGGIRVVSGTYDAYGQKLKIERGLLNFNGAYDNPGLNILAVRKRPEGEALTELNVEAGVEVRGTALAPTAKLVSTPTVPDSEKLAWLVLGHGFEGTAGNELGLLTTAAGALFGGGRGGSLQTRLANTLGLDELALSQARGLESTVVTVGKRISRRAYLSFEQGASTASSLVKLRYKLNPRVTLQFQTGANTALDVLYTWAFD